MALSELSPLTSGIVDDFEALWNDTVVQKVYFQALQRYSFIANGKERFVSDNCKLYRINRFFLFSEFLSLFENMRKYIDCSYIPTKEDVLVGCVSTRLNTRIVFSDSTGLLGVKGPAFDFSEKIPSELLAHICEYLPTKDISSLSLANKALNISISNRKYLY